jgi:hypothetical protein
MLRDVNGAYVLFLFLSVLRKRYCGFCEQKKKADLREHIEVIEHIQTSKSDQWRIT